MRQHFYLTENKHVVLIHAKRRPGANTIPRSTTWPVWELLLQGDGEYGWHASWEVTWGLLQKLRYIGSLDEET